MEKNLWLLRTTHLTLENISVLGGVVVDWNEVTDAGGGAWCTFPEHQFYSELEEGTNVSSLNHQLLGQIS